jgi:hypothetical protein
MQRRLYAAIWRGKLAAMLSIKLRHGPIVVQLEFCVASEGTPLGSDRSRGLAVAPGPRDARFNGKITFDDGYERLKVLEVHIR